jgi:hypothetical protein
MTVGLCDTLRSKQATIDPYLANTNSNGPALHEVDNHPNASGANNANAANSTITYDVHPANGVDLDAADVTDADAFQELSRGDGHLTTTNACEIAAETPSDVLEDAAEQSIEFESNFSGTSSVVIDIFPFGNPGAPIPGMPQGHSSYTRFQATQGDAVWAPFQSQRDWVIARWAKTHRTTSSAVNELLAFSDVCAARFCLLLALFTILGP